MHCFAFDLSCKISKQVDGGNLKNIVGTFKGRGYFLELNLSVLPYTYITFDVVGVKVIQKNPFGVQFNWKQVEASPWLLCSGSFSTSYMASVLNTLAMSFILHSSIWSSFSKQLAGSWSGSASQQKHISLLQVNRPQDRRFSLWDLLSYERCAVPFNVSLFSVTLKCLFLCASSGHKSRLV